MVLLFICCSFDCIQYEAALCIPHSCRGVLIKVESFTCGSALKDNFPMSLWAPLHTMLCQQETGCATLSIHVTGMLKFHRRTFPAMWGGLHRSPPWKHGCGASPSSSSGTMTPHYREICSLPKSTAPHKMWDLIHPVFHLCPPINTAEFPNPALSQCDR